MSASSMGPVLPMMTRSTLETIRLANVLWVDTGAKSYHAATLVELLQVRSLTQREFLQVLKRTVGERLDRHAAGIRIVRNYPGTHV